MCLCVYAETARLKGSHKSLNRSKSKKFAMHVDSQNEKKQQNDDETERRKPPEMQKCILFSATPLCSSLVAAHWKCLRSAVEWWVIGGIARCFPSAYIIVFSLALKQNWSRREKGNEEEEDNANTKTTNAAEKISCCCYVCVCVCRKVDRMRATRTTTTKNEEQKKHWKNATSNWQERHTVAKSCSCMQGYI